MTLSGELHNYPAGSQVVILWPVSVTSLTVPSIAWNNTRDACPYWNPPLLGLPMLGIGTMGEPVTREVGLLVIAG